MLFASRRRAVVAMLVASIAIASGAPSWGSNTESLHNHKHSKSSIRRPGGNDFADGEFNFNSVSPKDCANYLCVSSASLASDYIESGCPGQFVMYESAESEADLMGSFAGISTERWDVLLCRALSSFPSERTQR